MARRKELAVGQIRQLISPRKGDDSVAKVRIEALDVPCEMISGTEQYRYFTSQLLVEVRVLDYRDWSFDPTSTQQSDRRRNRVHGEIQSLPLPRGHYLVRPHLLGPIWDNKAMAAADLDAEARRIKKANFEVAIERQRRQLTNIFVAARVSAVPISWGHSGTLSLNALAAIVNAVAGRKMVDEVHPADFGLVTEASDEVA